MVLCYCLMFTDHFVEGRATCRGVGGALVECPEGVALRTACDCGISGLATVADHHSIRALMNIMSTIQSGEGLTLSRLPHALLAVRS
eukprot:1188665-Amphidinium_carterae.1